MEMQENPTEGFKNTATLSKESGKRHGKALRTQVPRESHAQWTPLPNRSEPIELLYSQGKTRVQALLPLRYERMAASPFAFFRGAALIMAADLANTPATGITVQACGDAHISNFGLFSSPEQRTVFDINDFDETVRGPWEWDVKRLATSVEICGRTGGFSKKRRKKAVCECVRGYREGMAGFAKMGHLDVWYAHLDVDTLREKIAPNLSAKEAEKADEILSKAKSKNSARAVRKLTEVVDGQLRIKSNPPLIVPLREFLTRANVELGYERFEKNKVKQLILDVLAQYRSTLSSEKQLLLDQYRPVDVAHKVVGVGSVGTRAWMVVMQGADQSDSLVLQIKEAQESVLERFLNTASPFDQHGQRVVEGQRAIQNTGDMLLGWCALENEYNTLTHYYVRQLWNGKGSLDLELLNPKQLTVLARACGWTLAHAHARTGDRFAIAAYLGKSDKFDEAVNRFATAYARQNELDYQRFMAQRTDDGSFKSVPEQTTKV